MSGNAGKGRPTGSRNKRTSAVLMLTEAGESPVEFGLRLMRDERQPLEFRLHGAKLAAPYVHTRPTAPGEKVQFDLPEATTPEGITKATAAILAAVARGELPVSIGRDFATMVDAHRRSMELGEIEARLAAIEKFHGVTK